MSRLARLVPKAIRKRYVAKFVVSILVVTVVVAAVGFAGYASIDGTVRADASEQLESTAELQADGIGDWVETMQVQTRTLSASSELAADDTQEAQGKLVEEQARMSVDVRAIHYVDADEETVVTSTDDQLRGVSLEEVDEPWGDGAIVDDLAFDDAVWHSEQAYESSTGSLDDQVMAFASRIEDRNDRFVVLVGTLEYRVDQLDQPGAGSSTAIVDGTDTVVLQPEDGQLAAADLDEEATMAALGGRMSVAEDEEFVRAYVPVADTDWVAVSTVPTDEAYGVAADVGATVIGIVVVSLLTLGVVGTVLGRQTVVPLARLRDRVDEMEDGNLETAVESNRIDEIGRLFDGFESMRRSLQTQIEEAKSAREEAERAREETEAMNRHLERKADEYSEVMQECAAGNLTVRLDPESESEAMAEIAAEFNEMVDELEETVVTVKSFATEVATASEEVTASSEEVRSASVRVSESVQEISDGATRQNDQIQAVTDEMNGLSTTTEQIAASSSEVADLAERTARTGKRGRDAAQNAIEGMSEVETESETAVEEIEQLQQEVEQIDELLEFITEVAEQTNMLALNANIEASRSGESSDGFAAVADEVKSLAEETKTAADDIERRLERIQTQTERSADAVQGASDRVSEHTDSVEDAVEALDEIADYATKTNTGVQEISAASQQQAASTQEVVAMADEVATIAAETSDESETVAAAAEEQTSALTEVSRNANALAEQASQLSGTLNQFEVDYDPAIGTSRSAESVEVGFDERTTATDDGGEPELEDDSSTDRSLESGPERTDE
ncbi:methyl-accepting chemotaxis protein [Natronobacterium texcoconense]|uniref:Methyl-accepting chemotaxis protein n=1 Tax=Natronobacterium texcoconense TaxID=1095778 RepID=A0A1H1I9F7_NATTX|nr:methyl-accepting chemotaxis protein [Natronobacterium texcoconense]SDR34321.1 methyl-accepting chemotaxis protein [Natronobacterium texcoconense]